MFKNLRESIGVARKHYKEVKNEKAINTAMEKLGCTFEGGKIKDTHGNVKLDLNKITKK